MNRGEGAGGGFLDLPFLCFLFVVFADYFVFLPHVAHNRGCQPFILEPPQIVVGYLLNRFGAENRAEQEDFAADILQTAFEAFELGIVFENGEFDEFLVEVIADFREG